MKFHSRFDYRLDGLGYSGLDSVIAAVDNPYEQNGYDVAGDMSHFTSSSKLTPRASAMHLRVDLFGVT